MKTVGQILRKVRLEKQISFEEVEASTKIRKEFLQALEEDNFSKLPSYTSGRGFIKNYGEFLGLSPKPILAIFRRDFSHSEVVLGSIAKDLEGKIKWNPKLTLITAGIIFFLGLSFYLGYQYFSFKRAPFLEVAFPPEGKQVLEEKIEVFGKAQPDASLTINDNPVFLSPKGEFHYQLDLFPGENKIMVEAKTKINKRTKVERTVFRLDK